MAVDVQPLSSYTWDTVLRRLGYRYQVDDENGRGGWFAPNPEDGTGRVRFEEDSPTDPNLQAAPRRLYTQDLAAQGFVPTTLGDLGYYAKFAQYGEGQGFNGNVQSFLDYVYGQGSSVVSDPTHGYLIKAADPAKAINGTPIALPNRSGSFGDFLKEGAMVIAPVAAAAFAPALAGMIAGGTATTASTIGAGALLNAGVTAIAGGDTTDILKSAAKGGAIAGASSLLTGVSGDPYEGLGYTQDEIAQLQAGTYSGAEQTAAQAAEQLGGQFDLAYGGGFPTSSSAYEGLGYSANDIAELQAGTYTGAEQTPAQVADQLGPNLSKLADSGTVDLEPDTLGASIDEPAGSSASFGDLLTGLITGTLLTGGSMPGAPQTPGGFMAGDTSQTALGAGKSAFGSAVGGTSGSLQGVANTLLTGRLDDEMRQGGARTLLS